MSVPIKVAKWSGTFPEIQNYVADATNGAAIVTGSIVILASDGELEIAGADPAAYFGVALGDFNGAAGYGMPSGVSQVTGREQTIPVALALPSVIFELKGSSDPALTNIDEAYGVALASGVWTLDLTETTAKVFHVVDVDLTRKVFFCRFLAAGSQAEL